MCKCCSLQKIHARKLDVSILMKQFNNSLNILKKHSFFWFITWTLHGLYQDRNISQIKPPFFLTPPICYSWIPDTSFLHALLSAFVVIKIKHKGADLWLCGQLRKARNKFNSTTLPWIVLLKLMGTNLKSVCEFTLAHSYKGPLLAHMHTDLEEMLPPTATSQGPTAFCFSITDLTAKAIPVTQ